MGVICVVTALVGGCGGKASDEDQVREVAETYAQAFADEDFAKACDQFTSEAKEEILRAGVFLGATDCPGILKKSFEMMDKAEKEKVKEEEVRATNVKVTGTTAEATLNMSLDEENEPVLLRKKGDTWLVHIEPEDEEEE